MPGTYWRLLTYWSHESTAGTSTEPRQSGKEFSWLISLSPVFLLCMLSSFFYLYNLSPFPLFKKRKVTYFSFLSHSTSRYWQYVCDKTDSDPGLLELGRGEEDGLQDTHVQCLPLHHACHCLWVPLSPPCALVSFTLFSPSLEGWRCVWRCARYLCYSGERDETTQAYGVTNVLMDKGHVL